MSRSVESAHPPSPRTWLRDLGLVVGTLLGYSLATSVGLLFKTEPEKFAIFWPPNGLLLGLLLLFPNRNRLLLTSAAFTGFLVNLLSGNSFLVSLGFALVNVGEPFLFAWGWSRLRPGSPPLETVSGVFHFFTAALAVCSLTAAAGAAVVVFGLGATNYPGVWLAFWLSDAMGLMLVAPVVLAWSDFASRASRPISLLRVAEVAGLFAFLIAIGLFVFTGDPTREHYLFTVAFLLFPVLLWSALRFGLRETTTAVLLVSLIAIWYTGRETGPFADAAVPATYRLLMVQFFLCVVSFTSLALVAALIERRSVEATLVEREHHFRAIFHSQFQFIGLMSPSGIVLQANRSALAFAGVAETDVIGQPFWETQWWRHDPIQQQRLRDAIAAAATGQQVRFEASHPAPDGSVMWVDFSVTPYRDERGEVVLLIPEGRDITQRKRIESELLLSNERLRLVIRGSAAGIWDWNILTNEDYFSEQWCRLLGYDPNDLVPEYATWVAHLHPEDHDWVLASVRLHLEEHVPYDVVHRLLTQNGEYRWYRATGQAIWDESGRPMRMAGSIIDVTQHKLAEERFRQVVESSPSGMLVVDENGLILLVNGQAERLFGYTRGELVNRPVEMLIPERFRSEHAENRRRFLDAPATRAMGTNRELFGLHKDGSEIPVEIGLNPLRTEEGIFVLASVLDIAERKRAESKLRASLREKETMLKEIHHRVKNNLTVIGSLFYLQSTQTDDAHTLSILQDCQARIRSMALVHESLYRSTDLGAIDFGHYAEELTSHLLRTYPLKAGSIRLKADLMPVELSVEHAIPCGLILNELIANALEHAYPDGQSGELRVTLQKRTGAILILSVADDGVGLPDEAVLEASTSLGMKLVRSLAQQLDGRLEYVRLHPGTEVRLTLDTPDDLHLL